MEENYAKVKAVFTSGEMEEDFDQEKTERGAQRFPEHWQCMFLGTCGSYVCVYFYYNYLLKFALCIMLLKTTTVTINTVRETLKRWSS